MPFSATIKKKKKKKGNSQNEGNFTKLHLIKDYYPEYTENSYNSTTKPQFKNGKRPWVDISPRRYTNGQWHEKMLNITNQ